MDVDRVVVRTVEHVVPDVHRTLDAGHLDEGREPGRAAPGGGVGAEVVAVDGDVLAHLPEEAEAVWSWVYLMPLTPDQ
ncbi:hypothetical protein OG401_00895 [Kitasatospora purpeofusca]|uniref:hypothetical protein n=1 Tax=Kitasatospora purpeofusca TaxID=67352 RepID=UPI0022579EB6|nr:hypothetical protein [Kitasatospora purpeofusca]MCX4682878.1 hypothetical protein [Kitasatospora purpeofusca]